MCSTTDFHNTPVDDAFKLTVDKLFPERSKINGNLQTLSTIGSDHGYSSEFYINGYISSENIW